MKLEEGEGVGVYLVVCSIDHHKVSYMLYGTMALYNIFFISFFSSSFMLFT